MKGGNDYLLTGTKRFIPNATRVGAFTLMALRMAPALEASPPSSCRPDCPAALRAPCNSGNSGKLFAEELYEKDAGSGDRKNLDINYNTGLAIYSNFFEGARLALKQYGAPLTPDKFRRGLESIKNYDANGLMAPNTVTATDHEGSGHTRIETWGRSQGRIPARRIW